MNGLTCARAAQVLLRRSRINSVDCTREHLDLNVWSSDDGDALALTFAQPVGPELRREWHENPGDTAGDSFAGYWRYEGKKMNDLRQTNYGVIVGSDYELEIGSRGTMSSGGVSHLGGDHDGQPFIVLRQLTWQEVEQAERPELVEKFLKTKYPPAAVHRYEVATDHMARPHKNVDLVEILRLRLTGASWTLALIWRGRRTATNCCLWDSTYRS